MTSRRVLQHPTSIGKLSETSPQSEVDTTLERGPGGLRAEPPFWPGCCEQACSQRLFGPATRQTLQMATARMYPGSVQHFWALLARTIGALEARVPEFWNEGVYNTCIVRHVNVGIRNSSNTIMPPGV